MKAISVFSGGLDSILAAETIRAQGLDVLALFFETPFFTHEKAEKSARSIHLPFKVVDITGRHLEMVKNPKHGYGGNMNPCIDCHALMIRIAGEMLEELGADFIITGEVLGQRPMSQNKQSLAKVASESGVGDLLLRPLSAKLLPATLPENKGWVDRDRLLAFQGRTRKPQMEMAKKLGITNFPTPAGGCLLTENGFSRRLKDLLFSNKNPKVREIELLKLGRHFRISSKAKLVVGRNQKENLAIRDLVGSNDVVLTSMNGPGPIVLGMGNFADPEIEIAAEMTASYSDTENGKEARVKAVKNDIEIILMTASVEKEKFKKYLL